MPDKATEFLEQMLEQRFKDIAQELHNIAILIEGYTTAAKKDVQFSERWLSSLKTAQQTLASAAPQRYLSGRWPLRDGDSYGIVSAQPPLKIAEPDGADDQAGDIRPSNIS